MSEVDYGKENRDEATDRATRGEEALRGRDIEPTGESSIPDSSSEKRR